MFRKEEILHDLIRGLHHILDFTVFIFCLFTFLISAYAIYDNSLIYQNAENNEILSYKPEEGDSSLFIKDSIAWLTVNDTNIDYPVMQGKSNDEYINKDPLGEYSLSGSIFLDSRNNSFFSDPYNLVYGHHMEKNLMFGGLDLFSEKTYFDAHKAGTLIAKNKTYDITFFSFIKTSADIKLIFSPLDTDKKALLSYLKENASIYEEPEDGNIIALSTCGDAGTIDRTVVFGILKD